MKKYKLQEIVLLLLLFLLIAGNTASAQKRSLFISGFADHLNETDSVTVWVYPYYFQALGTTGENVYVRKVKQHTFRFSLPAIANPVYVKMAYRGIKGNRVFLAEPGDSIVMKMMQGSVAFSGRGAARFECQQQIFSEDDIKMPPTDNMYVVFQDIKRQVDSLYETRGAILKDYQSKISKRSYAILQADLLGQRYGKIISDIRFYLKSRGGFGDTANVANIARFHAEYRKQLSPLPVTLGENYLRSKTYTDFIFQSELCSMQVEYGYKAYGEIFPRLFDRINEKCKGLLHDKLITACFLELFPKSPDASQFLAQAVKGVNNPFCRSVLQKMYSAKSPGSMAYDFSLENEAGRRVRLKEFRNKVVVADFWFNGCAGCINLNRAMRPVIDTFANRDDVVFVSINVDAKRDSWKDGIRKGIYTHEKSLNLFTNGLGERHPIIYHYEYKGFPNLLLIDKEGKVLSANPPLPYDRPSMEKLIQLINSSL